MGVNCLYARVSTDEQNLDHQEDRIWEYATGSLDLVPKTIEVIRDKSTGTDTDRSGYRELMEMVRSGEVERVIVRDVTRLGRSMRQINENVHELVEDRDVGLHAVNDDISIEPEDDLSMRDKMLLSVLGWAAELEAKQTKENIIAGLRAAEAAGKHVGRPPYGFTTSDDGYLQPNENFGKAIDAIEAVETLGMSHRKAARHSGVPRRTIPNILDSKDLYMENG